MNQQDYGMRIYDPRVGRFLSVDPITKEYPELTPYQFASNTPIAAIDIDGLEGRTSNSTTNRSGRGNVRVVSEVEVMARNTGLRIREGTRIQNEREARREIYRQLKLGIRPIMRRFETALSQYQINALTSAQTLFAGDRSITIGQNRINARVFENQVYTDLMSNPIYRDVAKQVTFEIVGTKGNSVRVRMDNVGIRQDGTLDFIEAKYSVYEITQNNVTRTLTLNQKDFFSMIINGDYASIKFVGGAEKAAQIGALSGTEISGKINAINIVVPKSTPGSNASPSNRSQTNTQSQSSNNNSVPNNNSNTEQQ